MLYVIGWRNDIRVKQNRIEMTELAEQDFEDAGRGYIRRSVL